MRVLLVGGGGREHALAEALGRAPSVALLLVAPGNPGTGAVARNVAVGIDDLAGLVALARAERIDLVVPGPEAPLVAGLADRCADAGIPCAGPTAAAARLEGSKRFARAVATGAGVPGPRWAAFDDGTAALAALRSWDGAAPVVKADGLAGGKGVVVPADRAEAEAAIRAAFDAKPGAAIVLEERLDGEEVSLFALCDGVEARLLGAAQDHKRLGDGDTGPNTGGMGAVTPPPGFDRAAQEDAVDRFVRPVLRAMAARATPFRGVLFTGLMLTGAGPRLIEYNVRFGDPEAQCLLPLLEGDLARALLAAATGAPPVPLAIAPDASVAVVLAAPGYPDRPRTGDPVGGIAAADKRPGSRVFHAATARDADGVIRSAGGRVLAVQARAPDLARARALAYAAVGDLDWPDARYRRDIGARALRHASGARAPGCD